MKRLTAQHGINALWEVVPVSWIPAFVGICHWLVESGYASAILQSINGQREATMLGSFLLARVYSHWRSSNVDPVPLPSPGLDDVVHRSIVDLSPVIAARLGVDSSRVTDLLLGLPKLLSSGISGSNEPNGNQCGA